MIFWKSLLRMRSYSRRCGRLSRVEIESKSGRPSAAISRPDPQRFQTARGDVLEGLVAGRANKQIAYDLGISARTIENYSGCLPSAKQQNRDRRCANIELVRIF